MSEIRPRGVGDLVRELATTSSNGLRCDCAFVASTSNYIASDSTYGLQDATRTGSSTDGKQIVMSLDRNNPNEKYGVILDSNRSYNERDSGFYRSPYLYKYVVVTNIDVVSGESGTPVFGDNGRELLGFAVSRHSEGSIYVKHEKFTQYFRGLTWDF